MLRRLHPAVVVVALLLASAVAEVSAQGTVPFRVPERWLRNRPLIDRFDTLDRSGRGPEAFAYLDSLAIAARRGTDRTLLLQVLVKRGGTLAYRRDRARGIPDLVEAVRLGQALRDTLGQLEALRWHAFALAEVDQHDRAAPLWRRMRDLGRAWGSPSHEGWAQLGLAQAALESGRRPAARAAYTEARALFRRAGDRFGLRQAGVGLQRVLAHGDDLDAAIALALELAAESRAAGDKLTQAQLLNNAGALEIDRGDPLQALRRMREAVALFRDLEREKGIPVPLSSVVNLANSLALLGQHDEACALLEGWIQPLRTADRLTWAQGLERLAQLRVGQGRPAEAERLVREALAAADTSDARIRQLLAARLGQSLALQGRAVEGVAVMQAEVARGAERGTSEWSALRSELARVLVLSGRVAEGLVWVERLAPGSRADESRRDQWRANALRAHADLRAGRPAAARARLDGLIRGLLVRRARVRDFESRESHAQDANEVRGLVVAAARSASGGWGATEAAWAFDRLQALKAITLDERLRTPRRPDTLAAQRPVTVARLRSQVLQPGELFADVHEVPGGTFVFLVERSAIRARWIEGESVLRERAERLRGVLASGDTAQAAAAGRAVGRLLFAEHEDRVLASRRLVVSLDGSLLPVAALRVADAAAPLVATHEIALVPSATVLTRLRARSGVAGPPLLALAGAEDARGRRLAGASAEVRWLGTQYEGVRVPAVTTAAAALAAMRTASVIHLAAHAETDDDNPWGSAMLLGERERPEAWLRAAQVADARLPARLAVLSGCRSIGSARPGEGALGLATAFLAAGITTTLATLWDVDDAVTAECVKAFYRRLGDGLEAAAALRAAQAELRARPATAHPRVWAAFVLVGAPETRVTLRRTMASRVLP